MRRVIDLNAPPGARGRPRAAGTGLNPARPAFLAAREAACRGCEHMVVEDFTELCGRRREWGCLGKARWRAALECPTGRW